jgi:hypothetical protein
MKKINWSESDKFEHIENHDGKYSIKKKHLIY